MSDCSNDLMLTSGFWFYVLVKGNHFLLFIAFVSYDDFIFPFPCPHALTNVCNLPLSFSIANVMKSSGCEIPDWMLKLKKPGR